MFERFNSLTDWLIVTTAGFVVKRIGPERADELDRLFGGIFDVIGSGLEEMFEFLFFHH